ncbi:MAG TPA: hypothetical protein VH479_10620 [Acidimicrobiales bacterium]
MEGTGEGEAGEATETAGAGDGETGPDPAGAWRRPPRHVVVVAAVVAGVVLIGGVALAAQGGDPSPPPAADAGTARSDRSTSTATEPAEATTVVAPTTVAPPVTEAAPTSAPASAPPSSRPAGTAPPAAQAATCFAPWPPAGGPLPTVAGGPGQAVAFGPPSASCMNAAGGCMVSVVLRWSDGYTEVGSMVLAEPGSYTASGDRGTNWNFTVSDDRLCSANGGNYANVWPPGT